MSTVTTHYDESPSDRIRALQRVLQSHAFLSSDSARQLLTYIVEKSAEGKVEGLKEYAIATELLGRPRDFDPETDNIVRVQVLRLRKKLEGYYKGEGSADPVRIVIPRGHYVAEFHDRPSAPRRETELTRQQAGRTTAGIAWMAAAASIVLNLALGLLVFRGLHEPIRTPPATRQMPRSLALLWQPFVAPESQPPLIVYSNPIFLRTRRGNLYRLLGGPWAGISEGAKVSNLSHFTTMSRIPPEVGPLYYHDAYTGVGEVVAAARVAQLLSAYGKGFSIQRSNTVSVNDIESSNVIFLGSGFEDKVLGELPVKAQLEFVTLDGAALSPVIRDLAAGKAVIYTSQRDPITKALTDEYALVSLLPGIVPGRHIMVLAGISTLGTEAAAEFAVSPEFMKTVTAQVDGSLGAPAPSPYFQVLLRVAIRSGAVAEITCESVRILHYR